MGSPESEARRALQRLRRSAEKSVRELEALEGALQRVEGDDFPSDEYASVYSAMNLVLGFCDEESARLQEKILAAGGLEPGRVRRGSA